MSEIERLKAAIEREREARPGVRWRCSRGLRSEVAAVSRQMVEEGSVVSRLAAELGVAAGTLERWLDGESGESGAERVRGFRRVDVVEAPRLGLILVTPSGYRVEGLELDQLQTLLPSLG